MSVMPALAVALVLLPLPAAAQPATSPSDATVFIRLVGSAHVEIDDGGVRESADVDRLELGTGSGFVISPLGRIDRVFSAWNARQLGEALVGSHTFEPQTMTARGARAPAGASERRMLLGSADGTAGDGSQEIRMSYAIVDLGAEKLVARYVGSVEAVAFNESVLRESLASIDAHAAITAGRLEAETLEWTARPGPGGTAGVPLPAGWVVEPGGPSACAGLGQSGTTTATYPARDFTVVMRAAVWPGTLVPESAASACARQRGSQGAASYFSRGMWLGVAYVTEGVFVRVGSSIVQLEVVAPDANGAFARALLAAWTKKAAEQPLPTAVLNREWRPRA